MSYREQLPQLSPAPRIGFGDLSDFNALNTPGSQFAQAWQPVQSQLVAEGNSLTSTAMQAAQNTFTTEFEGLTQSQVGTSVQQALQGAQQYVIAGQTLYGAVQNVVGLVQAAQTGNPVQGVESFVGVMVAAAVAATPLTAGLGAAIVGAVDTVLTILQAAGLFGSAPAGSEVCPGFNMTNVAFVIPRTDPQGGNTCCGVATTPAQIAPGAPTWRSFPNPNSSSDAAWFQPNPSGQLTWNDATFAFPATAASLPTILPNQTASTAPRPIDAAFPQYHSLECLPTGSDLMSQFYAAYFSAWKLNAAYALNGLKPQSDAQVLLQTLIFWNKANFSTSTAIIASATESLVAAGATCPSGLTYLSSLVTGVLGLSTGGESWIGSDGQSLVIYTGGIKTVVSVIKIPVGLAPVKAGSSAPTASTSSAYSSSTAATVATGAALVAGTALAGTAIYAYATKQSFSGVLASAWKKIRKAL